MYNNTITQDNINRLKNIDNYTVLPVDSGNQACGDIGEGRMIEPQEIFNTITATIRKNNNYKGTVIITAGPTREAIDPVRYISNNSSGKMGYALAKAFRDKNYKVILVSGPTNCAPIKDIMIINVTTAKQMYNAVHQNIEVCDIFVAAAAVCDYRMMQCYNNKIKKNYNEKSLTLSLTRNKDILGSVSCLSKKTTVRWFCFGNK